VDVIDIGWESLHMTDEPNKPIVPPEAKHPDDRLRVPLEAALGVIPGVSGLVKLVGETQKFYEEVDHQVMAWGSSTEEDARTLAKLLLEDEARKRTQTLHAASGWEKRRFNPAFRALLRLIPDGRVSGEIQPDYPARSLSLIPEDRAALRRFAGLR
jgi:hypothetical protein